MPDFRFYLERGNTRTREICVELPDASVVGMVAKSVARHYASHEIGTGQLLMGQQVTVIDCDNAEVGRYPLSSFVRID